ncbi:MAG: ATP-dependent Clp protease ATP-binding subunit [Candidatus Uhrbacteria bacterium]|nr:ATP-dependent Clp protease ATP-binding subunit [Candidatus Uhrbacteria bacterium]
MSEKRQEPAAKIGLASVDGMLIWGAPVDEFHLAFRRIRRTVTTIFHLLLMVASGTTLAIFVWRVVHLDALDGVLTSAFWFGGYPEVALFWLGIFIDCFLIFRLMEYGQDAKRIPGWDKGAVWNKEHEKTARDRAEHRFDVSEYFSAEVWEVIDAAYRLARNLSKAEVGIPHLFAASLASMTGARFLARVGLAFEKTKEPIAQLIRLGEASDRKAPTLSPDVVRALIIAYEQARKDRRMNVRTIEVFLACFTQDDRLREAFDGMGYPPEHVIHVAEWIRLREKMREDHQRFAHLAMLKPKTAMNRSMTARATPLLDRFSEDLTVAARNGYIPSIVGRATEMEELLRSIESGSRSVVLVGPRGVGKRALIEGLARRMVEEDVPSELFDRRLVSINIPQVVAAGDASLASERFFAILEEVEMSGNIILVLEGIEALSGARGSGPLDLSESLANELNRGRFIVIGTATPDAYTAYIERRLLGSKLARVDVPELSVDESIRVIMARSGAIEYKQNVFFTFSAIERAAKLASRYLHDRAMPSTALDVIREAAVLAHRTRGDQALVTGEDVASVVHDKTNIPVEAVSQDESEKLLGLEERLHTRVIGQVDAVTAVAQAMRRARAELREGKRPIANFLFLGPTGVGKTETAKALAAEYFGDEANMIRVDMSEYQEADSVYRMIGAAGDERGGLLTEAVRKRPFSIVLLDEIEKAHSDILNLFLQVMDDGRLTDGVGRTVDFTNVVLIATSNAGTSYIQEQIQLGTPIEQIKTALIERELKTLFRPEFLNRFDAMIVYHPLTLDDVEQICWLMLRHIEHQLAERGIGFRAEDGGVEILAKAGFDPLFGARPLRRVIQDRVDTQLADLLLRNSIKRRDTVVLKADATLAVEPAKAIGT